MKDKAVLEEVRILEGVAEYALDVTIAENAPDGPIELKFDIHTQACNDRTCLEPRQAVVRLPIKIAHDAAGRGNQHPEIFDVGQGK
jgi:hypothetical protein